jgi:hypothetical protein
VQAVHAVGLARDPLQLELQGAAVLEQHLGLHRVLHRADVDQVNGAYKRSLAL